MLFITHRLQAYCLKIISGRWPPFTSMHCCKRVWKLSYMRLRRSSIAATSSTMACLSSWIVMIRHWNTRSYRNPLRKKSGTVRSGDRAGQVMSPKREITVPNISRTTAILFRTIWNGVLSCSSPCRQPRQAIAPAQYSNSKCVSRLRATLYNLYAVRYVCVCVCVLLRVCVCVCVCVYICTHTHTHTHTHVLYNTEKLVGQKKKLGQQWMPRAIGTAALFQSK